MTWAPTPSSPGSPSSGNTWSSSSSSRVQGPIDIDGDEATTSCIVHEAARGAGESYYRNHCVVYDRLIRSGTGWVFTNRAFRYLWLDTSPFTGDSFQLPATVTAS